MLWFGAKGRKLKEFAVRLADDLVTQLPAGGEDAAARKQQTRAKKALGRVYSQARTFAMENRLGIYGRAKLANEFKWELKSRGYDAVTIDNITKELVVSMSDKHLS